MIEAPEVSRDLLAWYRANCRTLPWRSEPTPYRVWISEIMLQQTQVATVIPYFQRWMARFPTVDALAAASIDDVLGLWSGLGYYRRAHFLHRAAKVIADDHQGKLPDTVAGLLALPGIGRYTAGAIGSIAFGLPAPIVDGNVIRVLCRIFELDGDPRAAPLSDEIWRLAEALIPPDDAADFNQSMMELGALVCAPRNPACATCPVSSHCKALASGRVLELPKKAKRKAKKARYWSTALLRRPKDDHFLLVQRPEGGLFSQLWEFPTVELPKKPRVSEGHAKSGELLDKAFADLGVQAEIGAPGSQITHILTHIRLTLQPFEATWVSGTPKSPTAFEWVPREALSGRPLSAATRKIVDEQILSSDPNGSLF